MSVGSVLPWLIAASALIAAVCWLKSTDVDVPAPEHTSGVGAPMGGYLLTTNAKGERIDLHATLLNQTKWNRWAASAAAASAIFAGLSALLPPPPG
ncbi:hypothetical protein [uncultured Enterovirga sp.]|uniref:hypothetical protein n=1 Tax=uncultured Enterovirga sp. TaxID=2026352 RepID=UPI0035CC4F15